MSLCTQRVLNFAFTDKMVALDTLTAVQISMDLGHKMPNFEVLRRENAVSSSEVFCLNVR